MVTPHGVIWFTIRLFVTVQTHWIMDFFVVVGKQIKIFRNKIEKGENLNQFY